MIKVATSIFCILSSKMESAMRTNGLISLRQKRNKPLQKHFVRRKIRFGFQSLWLSMTTRKLYKKGCLVHNNWCTKAAWLWWKTIYSEWGEIFMMSIAKQKLFLIMLQTSNVFLLEIYRFLSGHIFPEKENMVSFSSNIILQHLSLCRSRAFQQQ